MDYNIYYLKFINYVKVRSDYFIEIYCNNNNYFKLFSCNIKQITFEQITIPKYIKYIHIRVTNIDNNKLFIFNIPNNVKNHKLILNDNLIFLSIKQVVGLTNIEIQPTNYINDNINKYIYHCELQTLIPDIHLSSLWLNINKILSYDTPFWKSIRINLTKIIVLFLRSNISSYFIESFIESHNINIKSFVPKKYKSFNDFFIRELLYQPTIIYNYTELIRSPISGRIIGLNIENNYEKTNIWIKGKNFTINYLIDENRADIKTILICRLMTQDYHHFHMPYTGILENIKTLGNDYYSVYSDRINSDINVLTENYRQIYQFKGNYNNNNFTFWLIPVGSFVVNSINHNMTIGQTYYSGQKIGNFLLGGSTVIILSTQKININKDIDFFSNNKIESYTKVGNYIGSLNPSNRSINVTFSNYYSINKPNKYLSINYYVNTIMRIIIILIFFIVVRNMIKNKYYKT